VALFVLYLKINSSQYLWQA